MNASALAFELDDTVVTRSRPAVARPVVEAGEDSVTGVAGIALWGELLDHLGLVGESDRRSLRPIGPGGYTGGECYRAVVETQLAGGDFLSDRSLLADEATQELRGGHALASHTTLWRFCAGADLGRASKAAAVNRAMVRRAWAMGAGPPPGLLTIDPDATWISTYGLNKEGSAFSYKHEVGMSPMLGVCGETGDVLALRARGGAANAGRAMGSFIDECVSAIPRGVEMTTSCGSASTRPATAPTWWRRRCATTPPSASPRHLPGQAPAPGLLRRCRPSGAPPESAHLRLSPVRQHALLAGTNSL